MQKIYGTHKLSSCAATQACKNSLFNKEIENIFNKIKTVYKYISCFCANFAKVWQNMRIH